MAAAIEGAQVDVDTALRIESRYLVDLICHQQFKDMTQAFFFDLQAITAGGSRPAGHAPWRATRVAVLGAGMMGAGIAYSTAKAGIDVVLKDTDLARADKGKAYSKSLLDKAISKGRSTVGASATRCWRASPRPTSLDDLAGCDLVIEAVFEDAALKHRVLGETESAVAADALLCSNTSTLPITGLAEGVQRRGRLLRSALLLTGRQDAAGRDHRGRADVRRGAGEGVRLRAGDRQDADRGRRLPRLLHLAGVRHAGDGGCGAARRGVQPGVDRAGRDAGRLPGSAAGDAGRAHAHAAAAHRGRGAQGGRGRGASAHACTPAWRWSTRWSSEHDRRRQGGRRRASTTTRPTAPSGCGRGCGTRSVRRPAATARSRSRTCRSGCCSRWRWRRRAASTKVCSRSTADANVGSIMGIGFPAAARRRGAVRPRLPGWPDRRGLRRPRRAAGGGVRRPLHPARRPSPDPRLRPARFTGYPVKSSRTQRNDSGFAHLSLGTQ